MIVIFLGAPGAGKGTQAALVAQELRMAHISSGDLFRQAVERDDEMGRKVRSYMERGVLVPDDVTISMVLERMSRADASGLILDGFPRNLAQAKDLDKALSRQKKAVARVVYIRVAKPELLHRLASRWLCRHCQTPYTRMAGGAGERCLACGGELYQRPDDEPETVKKRLGVYFRETEPLIKHYRKQSKLVEVDGEGEAAEVVGRIVVALGGGCG